MKTLKVPYEERLRLPLIGNDSTNLYTRTGAHVATGYVRIVIGERGPYVECEVAHIKNAHRTDVAHRYYDEWRTEDGVKLYEQRERVAYADYVIGKFYISPFELLCRGERVIEEMKSIGGRGRVERTARRALAQLDFADYQNDVTTLVREVGEVRAMLRDALDGEE